MDLSILNFYDSAHYLLERMRRRATRANLVDEQAMTFALSALVHARTVTTAEKHSFHGIIGRAEMAVSFLRDASTRPETRLYVYSTVFDTLLLACKHRYLRADSELLKRYAQLVKTHVNAYGTPAQRFHHYANTLRYNELTRRKKKK